MNARAMLSFFFCWVMCVYHPSIHPSAADSLVGPTAATSRAGLLAWGNRRASSEYGHVFRRFFASQRYIAGTYPESVEGRRGHERTSRNLSHKLRPRKQLVAVTEIPVYLFKLALSYFCDLVCRCFSSIFCSKVCTGFLFDAAVVVSAAVLCVLSYIRGHRTQGSLVFLVPSVVS